MEMMYIKYVNGERYSFIKEGEHIKMNNSKIIPFEPTIKENEYTPYSNNNKHKANSDSNDKINEEITNFFFNAIHKNYLLNRQK